jgi:hypothetical protein
MNGFEFRVSPSFKRKQNPIILWELSHLDLHGQSGSDLRTKIRSHGLMVEFPQRFVAL